MDQQLQDAVKEWLEYDPNPFTRAEIEHLVQANNVAELKKRLGQRISFGTAGLRGPMQAGNSSMNTLTVLQASQGLCRYLEKMFGADGKARGVVVGFDGRHNSHDFARATAATLISQGFKVYLFGEICPTPFVPFCVLEKKALAGVMVTASHNPKQDNGYKVYWENGSQIVSPLDEGIQELILANQKPWSIDSAAALKNTALNIDPTADVTARYYALISEKYCNLHGKEQSHEPVVYTPMHGVGGKWARLAFEAFKLPPFVPVKEQLAADPEFPTVKFPNPEEGKGALALAFATAEHCGARVVIANDPDADRLAAAERVDGQWKIFTGNELGIILAHWVWTNFHRQHPHTPADKCVVMNSTVSSKMLYAMAKKEGLQYHETLTGFKWMGTLAEQCTKQGQTVLYAFEEAIGFMVGDICRDKDGIRAAACVAELYHSLRKHHPPQSLTDYLNQLYNKYGYFETKNRYFFCYDPSLMKKIFDEMRAGGKYTNAIGEFEVVAVRDLTTGFDSRPESMPRSPLPITPSIEMITYYFKNGGVATLRGSGTEPKLKYYVELSGPDRAEVHASLDKLVAAIIAQCLQPTKFGLVPPSD